MHIVSPVSASWCGWTMFGLLLKRHDFRCGACSAKTSCRLLEGVKTYRARRAGSGYEPPPPIVARHLVYEGGKCVLCNRCVAVSQGWLSVHNRGFRSVVSPAPASWDDLPPSVAEAVCGACPTGALTSRKEEHA